ncbi:MAG TPA: helix-turn-helix domain-containing protein, partial [Mycobacterium sp.]|nr:helix-turn-helix domain-containing protein [Mycobacterium sp.]
EHVAWRPQREAAARNEAKVLDAARALLSSDAPEVDMRVIAQAAGVGVGTLYRRFGAKAGLLAAVIGEDERALQEAVLHGPPPLGPDAPPGERLAAFMDALVSLTERNLGALLVTDLTPPGRLKVGAYRGWRLHLVTLLRRLRPDLDAKDAGWHADVLLATVDPQLYAHQRREAGLSKRRIASNAKALAAAIAG